MFITDRGRPAHVLLSIEDYRRLAGEQRTIAELLAMPGIEDIELELPRSREPARAADLDLMFILDTNVVSELRKVQAGKADPHLASWSVPSPRPDLHICR